MQGAMLHYYLFKKLANQFPSKLIDNVKITDDLLFNLSTFNDLGLFFKQFNIYKKDKYRLDLKLQDEKKFKLFITECVYTCKYNDNFYQLLFLDAIVTHSILAKHIEEYLSSRVSFKLSYQRALSMLDNFYTTVNDLSNLSKKSIYSLFPNSFEYYSWMNDLISKPIIKTYSCFSCETYYKHSMKMKKFYYRFCSKGIIGNIFNTFFDIFVSHRGKKKLLKAMYRKKIDTSLLNSEKKPYLVLDKSYSYSFDEILDNAYNEAKAYTDAIHQYMFYNNSKPLKNHLPIDEKDTEKKDSNF